jgi:hypothetical protein
MSLGRYSEDWESDSDKALDYDFPSHDSDSDGSTVASPMLPPGASPRLGKSLRKKKGKGKGLLPVLESKKTMASAVKSLGGSSKLS